MLKTQTNREARVSSTPNTHGSGAVATPTRVKGIAETVVVLPRRIVCADEAAASLPSYVPGVIPPWAEETVAPKCLSHTASALVRALDIVFALVLLVLLTPLTLLFALFARIESPEPVFFGSMRLGKDLRPFRLHSMRTPRFGSRLVARLGLERVPSLINVLSGEMSLVGPTAEPPESFGTHELWQCVKWHAKPGVTGYAQARRAEGMALEETVYWDVRYVFERSLRLYIRILAQDLESALTSRVSR